MSYTFERTQHHQHDSLIITGIDTPRSLMVLPACNEGLAVYTIAPHAFESNTVLQEVILPDGLESVGRFAFLQCIHLRTLELTDNVQVFADTALRQCDALSWIRVHMLHNDPRVLTQLLAAVEKEITLELIYPDGKAVLLFPDYNYVYTEHTMSRAFLFNIDGCGMIYRECVDFSGVNFREYDRLFEKQQGEDPHAAPLIALNRLMYPYRLSPLAKEKYEAYFRDDLYLTDNQTANPPLAARNSSRTFDQDSTTVSGVASYAAGDGVFLLSAENRDERPDFLRDLILHNNMNKLIFLTKSLLLSEKAARQMLTYSTADNDAEAPSSGDMSQVVAQSLLSPSKSNTTAISALLMDYLRTIGTAETNARRMSL